MKFLYVGAAFILACVALSALAQTSSTPQEAARKTTPPPTAR
jgi:hypothetical protein